MKTNADKVKQLFEYLKAVIHLMRPVKRSVNDYEKLFWQHTLPLGEGCFVNGQGIQEDAWLEVHQQKIQPPPTPPDTIIEWFDTKWTRADKEPKHREFMEQGEGKVFFEESKIRVRDWQEYLSKQWIPWSIEVLPQQKIQNLYTSLFLLYQQLEKEGEGYELLWGHGFLSWKIGEEKIYRPLITTEVELKFDSKRGIFYMVPASADSVMELDMFTKLEVNNIEKIKPIARQFAESEKNPWYFEEIEPVLTQVVHLLSAEGKVFGEELTDKPPENSTYPVIYNTSLLFLRKKSARMWDEEFQNIIHSIDNGYRLPATIISAVSSESVPQDEKMLQEWRPVGEDLLFPLPANEEQIEIVKRLAQHTGVAVQGPPGTGKSHTIANLICHLLAHGKRVLVISQTERALKVLTDKIPQEIRSLCVSMLGGDSESIKHIERSVQDIAEKLSSEDIDLLEKSITNHKRQLTRCRNQMIQLKEELNHAVGLEYTKIHFNGQEMKPIDAAKWLKENEQALGWIKDNIKFDQEIDLSDEEMVRFYHLASVLDHEKMKDVSALRPDLQKIPNPFELQRIFDDIEEHEEKATQNRQYIRGWSMPEQVECNVEDAISQCSAGMEWMDKFSEPWMNVILNDIHEGNIRKSYWEDVIANIDRYISEIYDIDRQLTAHTFEFPQNVSLKKLGEDLEIIKQRLELGKSIGFLYKKVFAGKTAVTLENTLVNSEPITGVEDVELAILKVKLEESKRALVSTWNKYMVSVGAQPIDITNPRVIFDVKDISETIKIAFDWKKHTYEGLEEVLEYLGMPGTFDWTKQAFWQKAFNGLRAVRSMLILKEKMKVIEQLKEYLQWGVSANNAHSLWMDLMQAVEKRDVDSYQQVMEKLNKIQEIEKAYYHFEKIEAKLIKIAPLWVLEILTASSQGKELTAPENWREAIAYSQLRTWMDELYEKTQTEELIEEIHQQEDREKKLVESIVAQSTWLKLIKRTTEEQKRSLVAWLQFVRKIGKGTGKYANKHRENARKQMVTAKGAIPVWIMPIHRVIENIDLQNEPFDVVIVDESSQSNLFALSALVRAKKAVVVGDDNQISPEAVGVNQQAVSELMRNYLEGIPQMETFDMQTSLFDVAARIFPGQVMLKEHFRCVPEIIRFSNDLMYGGKIIPLRLPKRSERLEPAIGVIKVKDGVRDEDISKAINQPEAKAIVEHILNICEDSKYNNKSIGVISLQGDAQAKLIESMLIDQLGIFEMVHRNMICGDAYAFQGDERDVIFLSMVAASNMRVGALTKRSDMQRFNVAASRAKDQMFLYHSVELDELNPNCMRARLLRYCLDAGKVIKKEGHTAYSFDSKFEEDLYKRIKEKGYSVTPHVTVGKYTIGLVVEGSTSRLAIECIGDRWQDIEGWKEEQERQSILERVGWQFLRLRGSLYYRDPERALHTLWAKLDELGIMPSESSSL